MRLGSSASHIATVLVLHAAGVGLATPALITPSVVEILSAGSKGEVTTQPTLSFSSVPSRMIIEWLPKDNQTLYVLKTGEIMRLELNSTYLKRGPLYITVSPCSRNLIWAVYHNERNKPQQGWRLIRDYKEGETNTFSATVSDSDRYLVELRSVGDGTASGAIWARGERGGGSRLRLRVRSGRRLAASWDQSPIDPQATSYCVVASLSRTYASLCEARRDCRAANEVGSVCGDKSMDLFEEYGLKTYVRRKKYSRSTKLSDAEPMVTCVGRRTRHIFDKIDPGKTYHVSVYAVGSTRSAGVLLASSSLRPSPRPPRLLRPGDSVRADLKGGKALFYYKTSSYDEGIWLGVIACGGAIDLDVSLKGRRIHAARNIEPSMKFYVAGGAVVGSESSESFSFSSEEGVSRYVVRVTPSRPRKGHNIIVEVLASGDSHGIPTPELQLHGGELVRELRPLRSCSSLQVAFLPATATNDVLRYCVTARQMKNQSVASWSFSCSAEPDDGQARTHCADHSTSAQKVITQAVHGLQASTKYAVSVTIVYKQYVPVRYAVLNAETEAFCND